LTINRLYFIIILIITKILLFMLKLSEKSRSLQEQREELLSLNNDIIYWVYEKIDDFDGLTLRLSNDTLTCYPNQFPNLKWLNDNWNISILDINSLRKWNIAYLKWNEKQLNSSVLLSSWVIEFIKAKKWDGTYRTHTYTTLRDWWAADALQRTWVAWRNSFSDLNEEVEREYTEESPFLSMIDWKWTLATPKRQDLEMALSDLETSINYFLKNKYNLDKTNEEHEIFIKMFERSFKWIKYDELWDILREVIREKRVVFFDSSELDNYTWIDSDIKTIKIVDENWNAISTWKYFVYHDQANNTIEYRSLREIKLPNWFNPRQRLFLESQNQYAKTHRLEKLWKDKLVPTMKYFSDRVEQSIKETSN